MDSLLHQFQNFQMSLGFFLLRKFLCVFPCLLPVPYIFVTIFFLPIGSKLDFHTTNTGHDPIWRSWKTLTLWLLMCSHQRTSVGLCCFSTFFVGFSGNRLTHGMPLRRNCCHSKWKAMVAVALIAVTMCWNISIFAKVWPHAVHPYSQPCHVHLLPGHRDASYRCQWSGVGWAETASGWRSTRNPTGEKTRAVIKKGQKLAHMHSQHFTFKQFSS